MFFNQKNNNLFQSLNLPDMSWIHGFMDLGQLLDKQKYLRLDHTDATDLKITKRHNMGPSSVTGSAR